MEDMPPAEPITKRRLASFLGISERSIYNYQVVASQFVDDFLGDYPIVEGHYVTSAPLTSYQAWVIGRIHEFLEYFGNSRILKDRLENDRNIQTSWSKTTFMAKFPEYPANTNNALIKL